jgi:hypothetical protein
MKLNDNNPSHEHLLRQFFGSSTHYGEVPEADIAKAETDLGFRFPEDYRFFLKEFGAALTEGREIYGLFPSNPEEPPMWQNVIDVRQDLMRSGVYVDKPYTYLPISGDGMGVTFYLNRGQEDNGTVHAMGPGVNERVASFFTEFDSKIHELR